MSAADSLTRVTLVWEGKLRRGRWKAGTIRTPNGKKVIAANVTRASEGTRWIRGWHDDRTDDGKALLAAAAMAEGRPGLAQTIEEQVMKRIQRSIDFSRLYTRRAL